MGSSSSRWGLGFGLGLGWGLPLGFPGMSEEERSAAIFSPALPAGSKQRSGCRAEHGRSQVRLRRTWPASVPSRCSPPPQLRNFPPTPLAHLAPASLAQFQSGPGQLPTGCESHQTRPLTYLLVRELTRLQPRREHLVSDFQLTATVCPLKATAWIM